MSALCGPNTGVRPERLNYKPMLKHVKTLSKKRARVEGHAWLDVAKVLSASLKNKKTKPEASCTWEEGDRESSE